jgi:hypothetical protein
LLKENLKTSRAWMHKENFRGFWEQESVWEAEGYFKRWYASATQKVLVNGKSARTFQSINEFAGALRHLSNHRRVRPGRNLGETRPWSGWRVR